MYLTNRFRLVREGSEMNGDMMDLGQAFSGLGADVKSPPQGRTDFQDEGSNSGMSSEGPFQGPGPTSHDDILASCGGFLKHLDQHSR